VKGGPAQAPRVWVVRGGDNNELTSQIKGKKAVGVGFGGLDVVAGVKSYDELRHRMEQAQPGSAAPKHRVGQLFRFAKEIEPSDYVLTPEQATQRVHISRCSGAYKFDPSLFGAEYPHILPVEYHKSIPRTDFPQAIRNTLGSLLTVFRADVALPYVQAALGEAITPPVGPKNGQSPAAAIPWADEVEEQAKGLMLDALANIPGYDFQAFVAGLLEALGYKTRLGPKGKDGGVDVLAHPDAFGLASPRIKVQTKNQKVASGMPDVGYLHGVLGPGERGLFVCTGGFTSDARAAAFVKNGNVALVDGAELLDLVVQHYEQMPLSAQRLLPLRRLYVPETTTE
jgi:restriction system protein